ncbi:hypothetical protein BJY27_010068 [Streptomyces rapamycinicus]|uniref:Uncharacterized protein n=1 Tax=Streptomyces rapamycinicus TaxID=1226757 RepID=A0ABR6M330_9ACTN|nr:hypothetical protein [Streptomyces rapamycinicus]
MGAAHGAQIGTPRQQEGVDVVVRGDRAHRDDRGAGGGGHLVADAVGERGLVGAAEGRALVLGDLAGGDVDGVRAVGDERAGDLHGVMLGVAVRDPVGG